jgi:hypothetical protein
MPTHHEYALMAAELARMKRQNEELKSQLKFNFHRGMVTTSPPTTSEEEAVVATSSEEEADVQQRLPGVNDENQNQHQQQHQHGRKKQGLKVNNTQSSLFIENEC